MTKSKGKSTAMKYRPMDTARSLAKGTKPLAEAASVQHVLIMMVVHVARKIIYGADISTRIGAYIMGTLILSVIGDFGTEGTKSYFSKADNFFNLFFVKWGWGWTITFVGLFVAVTSFTTSCGNRDVVRNQVLRLAMGTLVWFTFTSLFEIIEYRSGICSVTKYLTKQKCAAKGYRWKGFDISGHCFLLIWNNLFIIEESKAYLGWERIKDMLRNEEHKRLSTDLSSSGDKHQTALTKLKNEEFLHLRANYKSYTPWVRLLFCVLALFVALWDIMLYFTSLYFHITLEKIIGASLAVLVWFLLYRVIYTSKWSPGLPGEGMFKYVTEKKFKRSDSVLKKYENSQKWTGRDDIPKFMGMPIYGASKPEPEPQSHGDEEFTRNVRNARKASFDRDASYGNLSKNRSRSRSTSRTRVSSVSRSSLNLKW